jgi:hypothetical protein
VLYVFPQDRFLVKGLSTSSATGNRKGYRQHTLISLCRSSLENTRSLLMRTLESFKNPVPTSAKPPEATDCPPKGGYPGQSIRHVMAIELSARQTGYASFKKWDSCVRGGAYCHWTLGGSEARIQGVGRAGEEVRAEEGIRAGGRVGVEEVVRAEEGTRAESGVGVEEVRLHMISYGVWAGGRGRPREKLLILRTGNLPRGLTQHHKRTRHEAWAPALSAHL